MLSRCNRGLVIHIFKNWYLPPVHPWVSTKTHRKITLRKELPYRDVKGMDILDALMLSEKA